MEFISHLYNLHTMEISQNELKVARSAADKTLFRKQVQYELDEIRQEAEEACALDNEIDPVPDSAYHDVCLLLEILFNHNVPMADIGWLMDGGIGFEWRLRNSKGIATISVYGDNQVIYGASLGSRRRVKGTCPLSDLILLPNFLKMASEVFRE